MDADRIVTWSALTFLALACVGVLLVHPQRRLATAYLVGITGALMGVQVGGVHAFTLVTLLWAASVPRTKKSAWGPGLLLVACAGLLAVTTTFGDLVNSPTLGLQLMALAVNAALVGSCAESVDIRAMLRGLLLTITLGAAVGVLQVVHAIPVELWHEAISSLGRPLGIWPEPDWMGLMAGLGVVLAWRLPLSPLARTVALSLNGVVLLLAFARAAWVAVAASVLLLLLLRLLGRRASCVPRQRRTTSIAVLFAIAVTVLVGSPSLRTDLGNRLETFVATSSQSVSSQQDISGQARLRQTRALMVLAETAAPFGHGLSASGRVGVWGELVLTGRSENNVSSNWILAMWVDGALLAVPLIAFFLMVAVWTGGELSGQLFVIVLVNSLWSNATFLPVAWLCVGMAISVLVNKRDRSEPVYSATGLGLRYPPLHHA